MSGCATHFLMGKIYNKCCFYSDKWAYVRNEICDKLMHKFCYHAPSPSLPHIASRLKKDKDIQDSIRQIPLAI